jgi:hypothetical protein
MAPTEKCPECAQKVSPEANVCPSCGNVLVARAEPRSPLKTALFALIVVGLVLLGVGVIGRFAGLAMLGMAMAALGGFVWLKLVQRARAKAYLSDQP